MIGRLAFRNIWRNKFRTGLTMAGIAVGVAMLIWTLGYMVGMNDAMILGATSSQHGQIQISTTDWIDTPAPRKAFDYSPEITREIESVEGVEVASPRIHAYGLVGDETTSVVAHIVGVEAERERETTVVVEGLNKGRWLEPDPPEYPAPREVVIGDGIARQLGADIGTEVVLFFEAADGSLGNDLLKVVGIVKTGSSEVDRMYAFMHLEDVQYAAALDGQVNEIAVKVADIQETPKIAEQISALPSIQSGDLEVRPWTEIVPQLAEMVELIERSDIFLFGIVYLIVAFGIFNTMRMSALERRREFGVTLAIGVSPRRVFGVVLLETIIITLLGALLGAVIGSAFTYYFVVNGLDLSTLGDGGSFEYMGVSFGSVLPFRLNLEIVLKPIVYIAPVAIICGFYPAWQASRIQITNAISGRS